MFGLIFDMDGVMADTEGPICRATMKMFEDLYGVTMQPEDFTPFIGTGAVRYVEGPAEKYGLKVELEKALKARTDNFFEIINTCESIALPGAHQLIDAAHAHADWKLAIATSSPGGKAVGTLEAAKIDTGKFQVFMHGDLVTHKKPHPEIYLKAIEQLQIPASQCVVVEDAVTGVESGKAAGAMVLAVTNSFTPQELSKADMIVSSLEEVDLDKLRALLNGK